MFFVGILLLVESLLASKCSQFGPLCAICNATNCLSCKPSAAGNNSTLINGKCQEVRCSSFDPNCVKCNANKCTQCAFSLSLTSENKCECGLNATFDPGCAAVDSLKCKLVKCQDLFPNSTLACTNCTSSECFDWDRKSVYDMGNSTSIPTIDNCTACYAEGPTSQCSLNQSICCSQNSSGPVDPPRVSTIVKSECVEKSCSKVFAGCDQCSYINGFTDVIVIKDSCGNNVCYLSQSFSLPPITSEYPPNFGTGPGGVEMTDFDWNEIGKYIENTDNPARLYFYFDYLSVLENLLYSFDMWAQADVTIRLEFWINEQSYVGDMKLSVTTTRQTFYINKKCGYVRFKAIDEDDFKFYVDNVVFRV